jgi:hypothetical protein
MKPQADLTPIIMGCDHAAFQLKEAVRPICKNGVEV